MALKRACVYFDPDIWHQFRVACVERHMSAAEALRAYVTQQVTLWAKENITKQKEQG